MPEHDEYMAEYDKNDPNCLNAEEKRLFLEFFRHAAAKGWSSPWSWDDWANFWCLGRMLWRTKREHLGALRLTVGGTRWSSQADSDWALEFDKWLERISTVANREGIPTRLKI